MVNKDYHYIPLPPSSISSPKPKMLAISADAFGFFKKHQKQLFAAVITLLHGMSVFLSKLILNTFL